MVGDIVLRLRIAGLRLAARSWEARRSEWASRASPPPADEAVPGGEAGAIGAAIDEVRSAHPQPHELVAQAYEAFQREIHSFALHATRDAEVAADVTQDAFLKLLAEAQAGRSPDNVRAWLYRVSTNMMLNRARHLRIADRVRRAWSGGEEIAASPEWHSLHAERTAEIRTALEGLAPDARIGLLLAASGFSGREVAAAIGRTELATRTLLCRARGQLRDVLGGAAEAM